MTEKIYYCAICDVGVKDTELVNNHCPYCGTEIPEAVEKYWSDVGAGQQIRDRSSGKA